MLIILREVNINLKNIKSKSECVEALDVNHNLVGECITVSSIDEDTRDEKKYHCEICGEELDKDEVYELDGMILCLDCYNEEEDLRAIEEEWIE